MTAERIFGRDLRPGDTIEVWFSGGRDTITDLRPYTGPLTPLFKDGAQIASFALNKTGMTIDNGDIYSRIVARSFSPSARTAANPHGRHD